MEWIKKNYEETAELVFKICYFFLTMATFISYLYVSGFQPLMVKATILLGAALLLIRAVHIRKYAKMPCAILMVLFCASFLLTTVMNREYGITENGKWIIWTGIQFFALYVCDPERDRKRYIREFRILSHTIILCSMAAASASLVMLFRVYSSFITSADGEFIVTGYTWGRLWGVYTDPNYGAVFGVIAITLSLLFLLRKRGSVRILYGIGIFLNFLYIVYSDSRTGEITLLVSAGLFLILYLRRRVSTRKRAARFGMAAGGIICAAILMFGGIQILKSGYGNYYSSVMTERAQQQAQKDQKSQTAQKDQKDQSQQSQQSQTQKNQNTQGGTEEAVNNTDTTGNTAARQQDIAQDISNGRFDLWKSAVEVWETSPVWGAGYSTFVPYARDHVPDTYAVNNDQGDYTSMHNTFFNTLAFQGLLGAVLFVLIGLRILTYILLPVLKAGEEEADELSAMLACVCAVAVSMMFLLEGVYTNSPGSFVLWVFTGYMVQYAYQNRREETK